MQHNQEQPDSDAQPERIGQCRMKARPKGLLVPDLINQKRSQADARCEVEADHGRNCHKHQRLYGGIQQQHLHGQPGQLRDLFMLIKKSIVKNNANTPSAPAANNARKCSTVNLPG